MKARLGFSAVRLCAGIGLLVMALCCTPAAGSAQGGVAWPALVLTRVVGGLQDPVHITHAGDGSGRIFVVERQGRIRILKDGALLPTPFLDITARVGSNSSERGLLSVAFPPGYAGKGVFYVDYTNLAGNTVVARFGVTANPDVADPSSEAIVLSIAQPYANHNGGQLAFSPIDRYLYIGMGDGGAGGDPQGRAQNPGELLGKLLRIDVESGSPLTYTIPSTNPYTSTPAYRGEIWALGLRNPWRFSFDRLTGDLYIGDVGQNAWEEIDFQPAASAGGENYGWNILEGLHCYPSGVACVAPARYSPPVAEVSHAAGDCSITGGFVYRGAAYPRMTGVYFYSDYCSGRIWGLKRDGAGWQSAVLLDPTLSLSVTSFGEDEAGNLYATNYAGEIYALGDDWTPTTTTATAAPTSTASVTPAPTDTPALTDTPTQIVPPTPTSTSTPTPQRWMLPMILKRGS